ncbi:MAG: hypothetical protein JWR38_2829 [Mucilaginibacter sp.]|nr:hypothetical protein [Mucilaginibacter sp.]
MEKQATSGTRPQHTIEFLRKRKFFLVLPLLILPFITMAFLALGGGKTGKPSTAASLNKGIDMALPSAHFKDDQTKDKMDIYKAAGRDSSSSRTGISQSFIQSMGFEARAGSHGDSAVINKIISPTPSNAEQQSTKIEARLAQINRQLTQPQPALPNAPYAEDHTEGQKNADKIRKMMNDMSPDSTPDPELQQLSKMMEQLQAIQNPPAVKTLPMKAEAKADTTPFKAIPAVIDGKQRVVDGGEVRLKLADSVTLKTMLLPRGQLLYGACQVTNQRLMLSIKNIRQGTHIIPVDLTVFSLDGLPGIPAHEAELAGTASGGADNTLSGMQFLSMDQSLGAQAAAGGIQAAKGLFSRKMKKIRVKLEDKFPVLLRDNSKRTPVNIQ